MTIRSLTPTEVVYAVGEAGAHKGTTRVDKVFFSGVSAGCLLAFACGTVLSTNTAPAWQESAPGLIRTVGAVVFPYGLCMILLTGADLCTGSFMVWPPFPPAVMATDKRLTAVSSSPRLLFSSGVFPGPGCCCTGW